MLTGTLVLHPAFYLNVLPDKTCQNKPVPWQVERRGLLVNILVLLPVNDRHRAILESSAPGEDFIYTSADAITGEQVANADVILGNIDPALLTACEHLQLLQLQTAGYDDYLAAGTVPAEAKPSCSIGAYGQAVSEHMFAIFHDEAPAWLSRLAARASLGGFGAGHLAQKRQCAGAGRGRYRWPLRHALPQHGRTRPRHQAPSARLSHCV